MQEEAHLGVAAGIHHCAWKVYFGDPRIVVTAIKGSRNGHEAAKEFSAIHGFSLPMVLRGKARASQDKWKAKSNA